MQDKIKPPAPVEVTNDEPIAVSIDHAEGVNIDNPSVAKTASDKLVASAKVDSDILTREDQRRISGMWERTQQMIALSVVWVALLVALIKAVLASLNGQNSTEAGVAFVFLASVANLVIGFYFGRTNHQRVGGEPVGR